MALLMVGLTKKREYDPVLTQYSSNRALISLCIQTVQLHSTTLTLTLDTIKLKDAVAATVPWRTFTPILDFYCSSYDRVYNAQMDGRIIK